MATGRQTAVPRQLPVWRGCVSKQSCVMLWTSAVHKPSGMGARLLLLHPLEPGSSSLLLFTTPPSHCCQREGLSVRVGVARVGVITLHHGSSQSLPGVAASQPPLTTRSRTQVLNTDVVMGLAVLGWTGRGISGGEYVPGSTCPPGQGGAFQSGRWQEADTGCGQVLIC